MENLSSIKTSVLTTVGVVGSAIVSSLGGWDTALQTLLILEAIDYIMGIIVAGVFHNSQKTETGTLQSQAGWKGLIKKCVTLLMVLVATQLDKMMAIDYVRYGMIIAFTVNALISIVENAGLMGIPVPQILINAIDVLKKQENKEVRE